jgi:hypothetical protein
MAPTIVAGAFVTDAERRDARIHDKASWIPWYEKWRLFRDRQKVADHLKASSITSSDSFTLSSARLNKPPGLDIR